MVSIENLSMYVPTGCICEHFHRYTYSQPVEISILFYETLNFEFLYLFNTINTYAETGKHFANERFLYISTEVNAFAWLFITDSALFISLLFHPCVSNIIFIQTKCFITEF